MKAVNLNSPETDAALKKFRLEFNRSLSGGTPLGVDEFTKALDEYVEHKIADAFNALSDGIEAINAYRRSTPK